MAQNNKNRRALIEAEAAAWLERLDSGEAIDRAAFEAWRSADAEHALAFAKLDAAWKRTDRLRALRPHGAPDADLLAPKSAHASSRRWLLRAAGIGGLGLLGLGGAALVFNGRASAETAIGERRALRLDDGTLLDLNTNSRASWRFTDELREVWLERGEAAIGVAGDTARRPFLLRTSGHAIALEPGLFNARLLENAAEIVVIEGSAALPNGAAMAESARSIVIGASGVETRPITPELADVAIAWRRNEIIFDGDTLEAAIAEYNRYLARPIEIADPSIADIQLGGRFTTQDPDQFLDSLSAAFPIEVNRRADGRVMLTSRATPMPNL